MAAFEPMRRVDAAWLHMDRPRNTADIVGLLGFSERVPFARIRTMVEERLLASARFRQRILDPGLLQPAWVPDPAFDLARHLRPVRLASRSGAALFRLIDEVATQPLDLDHSPWSMRAVDGGAAGTSLIMKLHHCLGDGLALVGLLLSLADDPPPGLVPAAGASRRLAFLHQGREAIARVLRHPGAAWGWARDMGAFASSLGRMVALPAERQTILSCTQSGIRRVAWTRALPLRPLKLAAHRAEVSANELILAAVAGALRTVLVEAGESVEALEPRALVPVNTRSAPATTSLGNAFGLVFLDLPVRLASPLERLAAVRERGEAVRRSPDAMVTLTVLGALGLLPPVLEQLGLTFFSRKASVVVTNVRGPATRLHVAGASLDRLMYWVPHPATLSLGISVLSYAGEVRLGVRADIAALSDPAPLARHLEEELVALGAEAPRPRLPAPVAEKASAPPRAKGERVAHPRVPARRRKRRLNGAGSPPREQRPAVGGD